MFTSFSKVLNATTDYVCSKLKQYSTSFKRNKICQLNQFYVEPKTLALGTRFEMKRDSSNTAVPCLIQNTYQYCSILETLRAQFNNEDFLDTFINHNKHSGNGHDCIKDQYTDFCCGSVYKNQSIFRQMNIIQIQLFCDEFEVCNPLGSHASVHKIYGVYFLIRNMPNISKLSNIFLVALFNSDDIKSKETDFNDIWRPIVEELKVLESDGIDVAENLNLKGTLIALVADNAGANSSLGFVESFNSNYYCRKCELVKAKCQITCKEVPTEIRTMKRYKKHLSVIEKSTKKITDFSETKGIKRYCVLNDLKYFDIFNNFAPDSTHDIPEGTIHFALKH